MGTLYLVATPIGNLEDISARALRTLRQAKLIAAEDTRVTRQLLSHFDIRSPLISYFEHNKLTRLGKILDELSQGDVALVSDAGTPALNDPGYELVRAALQAGHPVSAVPGPSSPITALVCSGLPTDSFLYLGYLPRKSSERRAALTRVADLPYTLIFLEAPHRLLETLKDMLAELGERSLAVARELTKMHEEVWRGQLSEGAIHFAEPRGEFVLVVSGRTATVVEPWSADRVQREMRRRLAAGEAATAAAAALAAESGWTRREAYKLAIDRSPKHPRRKR